MMRLVGEINDSAKHFLNRRHGFPPEATHLSWEMALGATDMATDMKLTKTDPVGI